MKRWNHPVRRCSATVTLPSGEQQPCKHHTRNIGGVCTEHRPPPGERVVPQAGPPHLAAPFGGGGAEA